LWLRKWITPDICVLLASQKTGTASILPFREIQHVSSRVGQLIYCILLTNPPRWVFAARDASEELEFTNFSVFEHVGLPSG